MSGSGRTHDAATRAKISRGTRWAAERRKRIGRIAPGELLELQRSHTISDSIKPYASLAVEEAFGLIQALGGEDHVSEQRIALVQDVARAGLLMRALMAQMLQQDEIEADGVSRVTSLINARRSNLVALGLDRVQRNALSLEEYVEQRENCAQGANDVEGGAEVAVANVHGTRRSDGSHALASAESGRVTTVIPGSDN